MHMSLNPNGFYCWALPPFVSDDIEVLAGLEMNVIAVVLMLSEITGLDFAFVRIKLRNMLRVASRLQNYLIQRSCSLKILFPAVTQ